MTTLLNLEGVLDRNLTRRAGKKTRQNNELAPDLDVDGTELAPRKPLRSRKST
jgi:hypothetical protein